MDVKYRYCYSFIIVIFLLFYSCIAMADGVAVNAGGGIPRADAVPFLGIETLAQQIKKAVCAVQVQSNIDNEESANGWVSLGSGFLVYGERNVILAITCKHVVAAALKINKTPFIGLDTEEGYKRFLCKIAYLDPQLDIAILSPQRGDNENIKLQNLVFGNDIIDDGSSLVEGRGVLIPGYPLALGVEDGQNFPVVRFGIIAQYTGKDYFLIDGVASHGNSGSPVFALKSHQNRLIGMVTSHVTDTITLFDETGKISARIPYNSGIARSITIDKIIAAIKEAQY